MGYLKVLVVCPLLQWLSSFGANLLHISTIDINKLLLLSLNVRWSDYAMEIYNKNEQKTAGRTLRNFNHEDGVYQVVTPYNDHRGGGGNHSHEVHVFARTCGCGKWQT